MTDAPDFHDGVPLWRDQRFVLLLSARVISVLGNGFAPVALAFAVLALPGAGAGRLSLVLACQALPQLLFILIGGVTGSARSPSPRSACSSPAPWRRPWAPPARWPAARP
ncbi:hypothetical protein RI578_02455 [Streptomyces sp. BB1-1-1]|uniref:hypothetical protein n=1 Tax=Streptomyces sp. BB1-1-1 TaxID=3074430 RepID=UPI002877B4F9|nr:hypothetical protein [Streptomyces sp. BB1-1-1]WND33215.1 hypothetical protein RI578_02455 [Streptomyces sp. BB1-1-1]